MTPNMCVSTVEQAEFILEKLNDHAIDCMSMNL